MMFTSGKFRLCGLLFAVLILNLGQTDAVEKVGHRIPASSTYVSDIVHRFRPHFSYDKGCMSYPAVTLD